jgi:PAS domain S-box-containing protein
LIGNFALSALAILAITLFYYGRTRYFGLAELIFISLLVAICFVFNKIIARRISSVLKGMLVKVEKIGRGDLRQEVEINSPDELGQLAVSFNKMTGDLRKSRSKLEKSAVYLEAMGEGLLVLDMDRKVVKVNNAALRLWGYTLDEITKLSFEDLFLKKEHKKHYAEMKKAVATRTVRPFETIILTKKGKEIPVLLSGAAIVDTAGKPTRFVGVVRDMREIQLLIKELEEAKTSLEQKVKKRTGELEEAKTTLEIRVKARTRELELIKENLEEEVKKRTLELQEKVEALEKFEEVAVGRELKMIELEKEMEDLKNKITS